MIRKHTILGIIMRVEIATNRSMIVTTQAVVVTLVSFMEEMSLLSLFR